jgi:hypothetical protein
MHCYIYRQSLPEHDTATRSMKTNIRRIFVLA